MKKTPSVTISQYIDSSRGHQWENVFVEQIERKEINKSITHGTLASSSASERRVKCRR